MSRIHLQSPDSDRLDHTPVADILVRQEPDEEEDEEEEEEDEGDVKKNEDEGKDDDYSE